MIPTNFILHRSIVNLTSPTSSPSSSHLPTFVDPSHPESFFSLPPTSTSDPTPPFSNHARLLRRTARSNLVNVYRRHVVPVLTSRFPKEGGFSVWVLHSMRRRAWERMEELIKEGARLQKEQQVLELRQRQEHEQEHRYHQERAKSPLPVSFGSRFGMEEAESSATTMNVPLSFSDEGFPTENENESANVSRITGEEVEDDLETTTDGSSIHTPSSTSHIGIGFMGGGSSSTSPTTMQRPPKPSPQLPMLPSHFLLEYSQLSCLRQRLYSLILFADSQIRISEEDKRSRDEILLVRGRRRAWLNGELAPRFGGMGQMQWGFAAPFKSSPLARYSWSASAELDESSKASDNYTNFCPQYEEDEDEYDEFHGPSAGRNNSLDYYAHGRQSRRSRYSNGGGRLCKKLLPVAEECECEILVLDDVNPNVDGGSVHDSYHHRDKCPHLHHQEDVDSSNGAYSPEPDLELGFGLHDSTSFIGQDAEELSRLEDDNRRQSSESVGVEGEEGCDERERRAETSRVAFEMERPKIVPRVRDGLGGMDDDSIAVGTSNNTSTSTRIGGGLLSWGYWGVGKNSGNSNSDSDGAIRESRSWRNGLGIGLGIALGSRGRSLNKTCQRRESEKEDEELSRRRQPRLSTSSSASTASSSSAKSQKQPQQHQREPAQVEAEPELHQDQDKDYSLSTPLLCQPVSFSVSHSVPAQPSLPRPATPTGSPPTKVAFSLPNDDTPTSPKDTSENHKDATPTLSISTNHTETSFVPTPLSFTTKKLCVGSPAPNVYADLDVSVVHVVEDEKSLNRGFDGASQSDMETGMQAQVETGRTLRRRPRRHKREYQYQYPSQQQQQHGYGNEDECVEFELSGYGQFSGGSTSTTQPQNLAQQQQQQQQRRNSMIHARLHLDELLLEEGLFNKDTVDQEEFTLAMDLPLSRPGGRASRNMKALKKMQFLQLYQNRDSDASQQPSRLQVYEQQQQVGSSSSRLLGSQATTANGLNEGVRENSGSVTC